MSHPNTESSIDICIGVMNLVLYHLRFFFLFVSFPFFPPLYLLCVYLSCCFFSLHCSMALTLSASKTEGRFAIMSCFFPAVGKLCLPSPCCGPSNSSALRQDYAWVSHLLLHGKGFRSRNALAIKFFVCVLLTKSKRHTENHSVGVTWWGSEQTQYLTIKRRHF